MCICDSNSLEEQMLWFIEHKDELIRIKNLARQFAEEHYDIEKRSKQVSDIFCNANLLPVDSELLIQIRNTFNKSISFRIKKKLINYLNIIIRRK